jgi:hypothetical protein
VNGFWGYGGRLYRMAEDWDPDFSGMVAVPTGQPGNTRGAVLYRQEAGNWLFTLAGCAKDHPPRDERTFAEWIASLPVPDFADALAGAVPLTDIAVWRQTANRLRRYDQRVRLFWRDCIAAWSAAGERATRPALSAYFPHTPSLWCLPICW